MERRFNGAVGIDLGTTTSSLAVYDEIAQKAECVCNKDGTHTLPSIACFPKSGECVIGQLAKEEYLNKKTKDQKQGGNEKWQQ